MPNSLTTLVAFPGDTPEAPEKHYMIIDGKAMFRAQLDNNRLYLSPVTNNTRSQWVGI